MAYIGKTPIVGNFQKCDALSASATADYTLQVGSSNVSPESVNHMIVSLNGVIQQPTTAYTVSGATLSFASALTSSDTIDFVILLGNVLDIGTPSDDTVATAKIQDDAVTAAKINTDLISGTTALAVAPADTDEFLVSDAGTLKRIDYSLIKGGASNSFLAHGMSGDASGDLVFDSELHDDGGNYDTSNGRYTAPSDGYYLLFSQALKTGAAGTNFYFKKNGTAVIGASGWGYNGDSNQNQLIMTGILSLDATDYIHVYSSTEVYGNQFIVFGGCKLY